jgi:hypothetical protein
VFWASARSKPTPVTFYSLLLATRNRPMLQNVITVIRMTMLLLLYYYYYYYYYYYLLSTYYLRTDSTLNLSDIIAKIRTVAMFVIVDSQSLFMLMANIHTKCHTSSSNGLLFIAVTKKAEYFRTTAMSFYVNKCYTFLNCPLVAFIISGLH